MMPAAARACSQCGASNPSGSPTCVKCATPIPQTTDPDLTIDLSAEAPLHPGNLDRDATIASAPPEAPRRAPKPTTWGSSTSAAATASEGTAVVPGTVLGDRYEILKQIGEGGMGAVFKARDREVDRVVALKIIRPELANNTSILSRFKQELVLARQVTDRNVIRIFDLGSAGDLKFITMEYVEGTELKTLLRLKGKYSAEAAGDLMLQICSGLAAAHAEKVIHRDLKPQNVMVDDQGRALVMDFGLAFVGGGQQAGEGGLLGTPDYMSPEQVKRVEADERSDIYSLGVMLFELLTGRLPFRAEKPMQSMRMRVDQKPPAAIEIEPSVPQKISDVALKCMAVDPKDRYQTVQELIHDLQVFRGIAPKGVSKTWKAMTAALGVLVLVFGGLAVNEYRSRPAEQPKTVTMLVADFENSTGEAVFTNTIEPMFSIAMEEAAFINSYSRPAARQLVGRVKAGATKLDDAVARLVAVREGVNVVVTGAISKSGSGYRCAVKALDSVSGQVIASEQAEAPDKERLLAAMPQLALPIRKALGEKRPKSEGVEQRETFTAASLEAASSYFRGQELQLQVKYDEAIKAYEEAIRLDASFGRAYSGLGVIYRNQGQRDEAEKYLKLALQRIGQMSLREQFRTRGAYFVTVGNFSKAVEEYSTLVEKFPADNAGHANLAICYLYLRKLDKAIEEGHKAIAIYPRNVGQRNNIAQYLLYAGRYPEAEKQADEVLGQNPTFERALVVKALSNVARGNFAGANAMYERVGRVSARGASYRLMGLADLALFEGHLDEGIGFLQEGISEDAKSDWKLGAAGKQIALAKAYVQLGRRAAAIAALDQATAVLKENGLLYLAAQTYVDAGQPAKASALAEKLAQRVEPEAQAYAKLIAGEVLLAKKDARGAVRQIEEARKLADTWVGLVALGRAYLALDAFTEADAALEAAFSRAGEATSVTFDAMPTYSLFPPVLYYLGVARQGMSSPSAAESFLAYLGVRQNAKADPFLADARKRLNTL